MYKILEKNFGYQLTFNGLIQADEMQEWVQESKDILTKRGVGNFGVLIDMRNLSPLSPEAQNHMQDGQKLFKASGMIRSTVILANPIIQMQFKRIAKDTGIYKWERYIDASTEKNWVQVSLDWVKNGIDPDL